LHADHQGSLIAQSNPAGTVLRKYTYSPFGESTDLPTQGGSTIGYTGQRFDAETGLYYYMARHYNPATGRFLQPDPLGYGPGMNLYGYVHNDPVNRTDPAGTDDLNITMRRALGSVLMAGENLGGSMHMAEGSEYELYKGLMNIAKVGAGMAAGGLLGPAAAEASGASSAAAPFYRNGREVAKEILDESAGSPPAHAITSLPNMTSNTQSAVSAVQGNALAEMATGQFARTQAAKAGEYLAKTYGGAATDWVKFETEASRLSGTSYNMSVHGFVNAQTGEVVNAKTVMDYVSGAAKQFGGGQ
jgi:RHS repeat-associated protein